MTQSKKYDYLVAQNDTGWTTEIIRRVSSTKSVVSKAHKGFTTEAEAQQWGEAEVKALIKKTNLAEQEKRRAKKIKEEQKNSKIKEQKD
jgi:hypothetical protein